MKDDARRLGKRFVLRVSGGQYAGFEGAAAREHLLVSAWARRVLVRAAAAQRRRAVAAGEVESVDGALVVSTSAGRGSRRE
jgi:hypothetical protein